MEAAMSSLSSTTSTWMGWEAESIFVSGIVLRRAQTRTGAGKKKRALVARALHL